MSRGTFAFVFSFVFGTLFLSSCSPIVISGVSLTVNPSPIPSNSPLPIANAQSVTVIYNTAKSITLTGTGSIVSYTVVANPSHGMLSGTAPNLTYTPNQATLAGNYVDGYSGSDSFTFKVSNGTSNSIASTVSISVSTPLFFCDQGNHTWASASNWFKNQGCTAAAGRVPTNGDFLIFGEPGTYTVASFVDQAPTLSLAGYAGPSPDDLDEGGYGGTCTNCTSKLTVQSHGVLYITYGFWTGATADATVSSTFTTYGTNGGTINGNATFGANNSDSGFNAGTVTGNATFNGSSENVMSDETTIIGVVDGNVIFNDSSANYTGVYDGTCTGNDGSLSGPGC